VRPAPWLDLAQTLARPVAVRTPEEVLTDKASIAACEGTDNQGEDAHA